MNYSLASRNLPWIAATLLLATCATHAATCYVIPAGAGTHDGSSWQNAATLPAALANSACSETWVAAGIYKPTATSDRTISFRVSPGMALYGGFAGVETLRDQRDPGSNKTVLSGDIDGNDLGDGGIQATTASIQGSNAYHVVYLDGTVAGQPITSATVLDGFYITGGDAAGSANDGYGGGLFCNASSTATAQCTPILRNIVFSGNRAKVNGGALQNWAIYGGSASPTLENVTFRGNAVIDSGGTARGGAVYNEGYGGESSPVLINVTFVGNTASNVGADAQGGAMYNSGYYGISSPKLTNVTFSGNTADYGGAMFNDGVGGGTCHPQLVNTILWGNAVSVGGAGPQIDETNGAASVISYSVVEGGCPGGSICSNAPITLDPHLGTLQDNGGFVPTVALAAGSSAIDAGSAADCPATDARGIVRPVGAGCDIGAFEATDPIFANGFDVP